MTREKLLALFEEHDGEYIKFERVQNPLSKRPDLHAFMLLDKLCPTEKEQDMVVASDHDEFWLAPGLDTLAKVVTEEQIVELIRCGCHVDESNDCLSMFT